MTTKHTPAANVIQKAWRLIEVLGTAEYNDGVSATELAKIVDMPVQSAHRLLTHLSRIGLTFQHARTKRWFLGLALVAYGRQASRQFPLLSIAQPVLQHLVNQTRETVILTVRDGDYGIYAEIIESPEKLRLTETVGMRLPLWIGASRKVILAHLPDVDFRATIERFIRQQPTLDRSALENECARIRQDGYASSFGEVTKDTVGITVAIVNRGYPMASLMVAGPQSRITENAIPQLVRHLRSAALDISTILK